ncbi:MAG TPA: 2-oxoglutarate and iron-dependent oxygenase domain-containing protein [Crinalium sp.]|jgi:isopenicillin N synthase-like dioxygenase
MPQIPVINFGRFITGSSSDQMAIASEIYQAFREIGFLYLSHHGISANLIERVLAQSHALFALPGDVKERYAWSAAESNRGYVGVARERLNPTRPGDLKEAFNIGREPSSDRPISVTATNRWVSELPDFKSTALEFYDACTHLANQILTAMAIALQLPSDFFTLRHDEQQHTLRLLHYPPLPADLLNDQVRAGEHSDYGSLTLLFQDSVGGLEVQTVGGDWIAALPIADTILVNLGDLMERWTNHVFRSTKHRVLIPDAGRSHQSRYSVAFFCEPNPETAIACLESCQSPEQPPLYPPITAGAYLLSRLQATY